MSYARVARRGTMRVRRGAVLLVCLLASSLPAPSAVEAAAPHGIDGVNLYVSRGFVHGSAWFKDAGPGRSRVHVWIDTYSGATGRLTGSVGHRTGVSACGPGATCYVLLTTRVQATAGECYVLRALSARGADLAAAVAPAADRFCP